MRQTRGIGVSQKLSEAGAILKVFKKIADSPPPDCLLIVDRMDPNREFRSQERDEKEGDQP